MALYGAGTVLLASFGSGSVVADGRREMLTVLRELPISSESEIEMVCRGARTLDSVLA